MSARVFDLPVEPAQPMVTLRGGVTVPVRAVVLAIDLEARGITMRVDTDGALVLRPRALVTLADAAQVRENREALKVIATYEVPPT